MWFLNGTNQLKHTDSHFVFHSKDHEYTIGRKECDINVEEKSISRKHCSLKFLDQSTVLIKDFSKFGTFIGTENDRIVDKIQIDISTLELDELVTWIAISTRYHHPFRKGIFKHPTLPFSHPSIQCPFQSNKKEEFEQIFNDFSSKKYRNFSPQLEEMVLHFIDLSSKMSSYRNMREVLVNYKIICQNTYIESIQKVFEYIIQVCQKDH